MDTSLFFLINRGMANPFFDALMPFLSYKGYLLVLPFLALMIYRAVKEPDAPGRSFLSTALRTIVIAAFAVIIVDVLEAFLKPAIGRIRPCHALEGVRLLTLCPEGRSMPSGHALSSFAFAIPLFYLTRGQLSFPARLYPLILAGLIAFSRVYVGVHYPADVLAGALLGSGIAMTLIAAYSRIPSRMRHA